MRHRHISVAALLSLPMILGCIRSQALQPILTSQYSSRRTLYFAHRWLLWTNVLSDVLTIASYALFFVGLCLILRKIGHIEEIRKYLWLFVGFRIFILACAATIVIRIVNIWFPLYQFSIALKIICAAASIPTAVLFAWQSSHMAANVVRFFDLLLIEKQQSDRLRKSEEFLDRIGHIAGIGGWELDLNTKKVTWSAETCRIHGLPLDHKPTMEDGFKRIAPEGRPRMVAAVKAATSGGPGWDIELPLDREDGRRIWVRVLGGVDLQNGKPVRLIGAFQDVTAAVEAREELSSANERVALATESGGIGIWDWNILTGALYCDRWMHRLHGKDPRTHDPDPLWRDHLHPDDRARVEQALTDAIEGSDHYDTEFRVIWKDGSVHHLRGAAKVTRDESGRPLRMVGANWDVTESRRLTAELAQQHELLRVTLQAIGDGVITTDSHRNVAWLNPSAERMTGWLTTDAIGLPLSQIFRILNGDTRKPMENPLANRLVQGSATGIAKNTLLVALDGSEISIENSVAPIRNYQGELLGNVLVFRDVTEQRRLTAETERVSKLQIDLKTKDEFLSHVSHELRSPLTSIYSFTSIITDGLTGETTPEQKDYLQIILKNVVQLQAMIEDLLTVTQTREGKLSIELQSVSASEAVEDAMHTIQGAAAVKGVALSSNHHDSLPDACADPTRLRQVLIILLDNAVKFTPAGGTVSVAVSEHDRGFLLLQVADTGCGIPLDKRALVFENLYQVRGPEQPDTTQAGRTGLGLGLHIARNLVTRQGGRIWVSGEPGHGSTFNFTLPIYSEETLAANVALAAGVPRRRITDRLPPPAAEMFSAA